MKRIHKMVAVIRLKSIYECSCCGKIEAGEMSHHEYTGHTSEGLKEYIDGIQQTSHNMPVGWSYNGKFTCPDCTK